MIVPSKNESIIYNYQIDEYLYLKVHQQRLSNPSTTRLPNSRGRRPPSSSSITSSSICHQTRSEIYHSSKNQHGSATTSSASASTGPVGPITWKSRRTTCSCPASSSQKRWTCTNRSKLSSWGTRSTTRGVCWGSGCTWWLRTCSMSLQACFSSATLTTWCINSSGMRTSMRNFHVSCWYCSGSYSARPSSKRYL